MDQPTRASCPYCQTADGFVRAVRIAKDDQRTLTYVCASCCRSWDGEPHFPDWPEAAPMLLYAKQSQPDDR